MVGDAGQHAISSMVLMCNLTLFAVKFVINLAAELNFVAPVRLAIKLLRIEREVIAIAQPCVILRILAARHELLETHVV